jgi:hypothetical protein
MTDLLITLSDQLVKCYPGHPEQFLREGKRTRNDPVGSRNIVEVIEGELEMKTKDSKFPEPIKCPASANSRLLTVMISRLRTVF